MRISMFVTLGNEGHDPDYWQYKWREALQNYCDFADEVVVVWGGTESVRKDNIFYTLDKIKPVYYSWPYDFNWSEIAKHFNAGLEACTGDWIIKMDIDYIIHEKDFPLLRAQLEKFYKQDYPLCSMVKYTVLDKGRVYQKVPIPFIVNKKMVDSKQIRFGIAKDEKHNAWGYPIYVDGFDEERGLPTGHINNVHKKSGWTGMNVWNYDNIFKTKEVTEEHWWRFSQARIRAGFKADWGTSKEVALKNFSNFMYQRNQKTRNIAKEIQLEDHPKIMQEAIANLQPDQFGYNNWNNFEGLI